MEIYLDNSATTRCSKSVCDTVVRVMSEEYGNPSSQHMKGMEAERILRTAREEIASTLKCGEKEIFFTSGGTESDNWALIGGAMAHRRAGSHIITTSIEHEAVLQPAKYLEQQGFTVTRVPVSQKGYVSARGLEEALGNDTLLVSIMYVNNEVGSVLPVKAIKKAVTRAGAPALIHIDCVQAFGKTEVKPKKLGADLVTVTAHKIHGPKGIGALYIRKGVRIVPRQYGGAQESKIRPGTEAAELIAGFGTAVELIPDFKAQNEKVHTVNAYAKAQLSAIPSLRFNSGEEASDYILNLFVPSFMTSQTIVQHLSSAYGICISSGSACAKGKKSHVLTSMRLPDKVIEHSVRVSFSRHTTKEDIDALVAALRETTEKYPL